MTDEAVFERDGERFVPGRHSIGPWAHDRLHGGPVQGLIARAVEQAEPDPELVLARLSVDLFRPVPQAPLSLSVETLRKGSRLALLRVHVLGADGVELAQGTALLLRASDAPAGTAVSALPHGPEGLNTESLGRGAPRASGRPSGFHTMVQTRWVPREEGRPLAVWFRLPIALVAGEPASPLVSAIALSDFANAVAAMSGRAGGVPYVNADSTVYLTRRPQGEWFCLQEHACTAERGISTAHVQLYDSAGALGHTLQARITVR
jgi:hypothetical protein